MHYITHSLPRTYEEEVGLGGPWQNHLSSLPCRVSLVPSINAGENVAVGSCCHGIYSSWTRENDSDNWVVGK